MEKFTESPWILDNDQQTGLIIHDKHDRLIAEVAGDDWNPAESLANAQLITAAPELLFALINCAELLAEDVPEDAVAAIKKALGDQYVETNS